MAFRSYSWNGPSSDSPNPSAEACTASRTASRICSTGVVSARICVHLHPKTPNKHCSTADLGDLRVGFIPASATWSLNHFKNGACSRFLVPVPRSVPHLTRVDRAGRLGPPGPPQLVIACHELLRGRPAGAHSWTPVPEESRSVEGVPLLGYAHQPMTARVPFSRRHRYAGPAKEITIREDALEGLRVTVLDTSIALGWSPTRLRGIICPVLRVRLGTP